MRPPVVTNVDREWAMAQMPDWCQRGDCHAVFDGEIVDDGGWLDNEADPRTLEKPSWALFVAEEIEKFEHHYRGQLRHPQEWSSIWRRGWWPKVCPRRRFPKSAPKEFQPFFREGTRQFDRALKVATADEKRMWRRFGVAQFKPDDPRLPRVLR